MFDFDKIKTTFIENWTKELHKHSVQTISFPLLEKEIRALIAFNYMTLEDGEIPSSQDEKSIKDLKLNIDYCLKAFPGGAFVKLGSRSPKDAWCASKNGFNCASSDKVIQLFCDSERIYNDLYQALRFNYTPHIAIREWINIKPWQEFRAFYKNYKLVGLSQYNYLRNNVFPEVAKKAETIEQVIKEKSEAIAHLLPIDNIIVDYVFQDDKVILLECNPFIPFTDPCLFDWKEDTFDKFEFRYLI